MASRSSSGARKRRKKKGNACKEEAKDPRNNSDTIKNTIPGEERETDGSEQGRIAACAVEETVGKGSTLLNYAGDNEKSPVSTEYKKSINASGSASDQTISEVHLTSPTTILSDPTSLAMSTGSVNLKSSLDEELEWCIIQLKLGMLRKVATKSQKEQNLKNTRTLQSAKVPLPKKRQLMRSLFGDYRSKMKNQSTSTLLDKSRVVAKDTKVEAVKPNVLESMGTYFRKKTRLKKTEDTVCKDVCIDVGTLGSSEGFKFNFSIHA